MIELSRHEEEIKQALPHSRIILYRFNLLHFPGTNSFLALFGRVNHPLVIVTSPWLSFKLLNQSKQRTKLLIILIIVINDISIN